MNINIIYNDFNKKKEFDLNQSFGEIQYKILSDILLFIYNIEHSELIINNTIKYILGINECNYSITLYDFLKNNNYLQNNDNNLENIDIKIITYDRKRDNNGNVIKENLVIDKYNLWYNNYNYQNSQTSNTPFQFPIINIFNDTFRRRVPSEENIQTSNINENIQNDNNTNSILTDNNNIQDDTDSIPDLINIEDEINNIIMETINIRRNNTNIPRQPNNNVYYRRYNLNNSSVPEPINLSDEINNIISDTLLNRTRTNQNNNMNVYYRYIDLRNSSESVINNENNQFNNNQESNNETRHYTTSNSEESDNEESDYEESNNEESDNEESEREESNNEEINSVIIHPEENYNQTTNIDQTTTNLNEELRYNISNRWIDITETTNTDFGSILDVFNNYIRNINTNTYTNTPEFETFDFVFDYYTPSHNIINYSLYDNVKVVLNEDTFNNLEKINFNDINKELFKDCLICLDTFEEDDEIIKIKCNHVFHCNCIKSWLCKESNKCPVCRIEVDKGEYINL